MVDQAKLKKKAADFEQKRQYDRALAAYAELLGPSERIDDHDIALFNRVGELYLRQGQVAEGLRTWERGAELYAERGFYTNAIALCSKVLRQPSARPELLLKLARLKISAGFRGDAQQHVEEYLARMRAQHALDVGLQNLRALATEHPDEEDVQVLAAELLARHGRAEHAVELLAAFRSRLVAAGRAGAARAVVERIRALDPSWTPPDDAHHAEGTLLDEEGDVVSTGGAPSDIPGLIFFEPTEVAEDRPPVYGRVDDPEPPRSKPDPSTQRIPGIPITPAEGLVLGFEATDYGSAIVEPPTDGATAPASSATDWAPEPAPSVELVELDDASAVEPAAVLEPRAAEMPAAAESLVEEAGGESRAQPAAAAEPAVDEPPPAPAAWIQPGSPEELLSGATETSADDGAVEPAALERAASVADAAPSDGSPLEFAELSFPESAQAGDAGGRLMVESALGDSGFGVPEFADASTVDPEAPFGDVPLPSLDEVVAPPAIGAAAESAPDLAVEPAPARDERAPLAAPPEPAVASVVTEAPAPRVDEPARPTPPRAPAFTPPLARPVTGPVPTTVSRPSRPFVRPVTPRPSMPGMRAIDPPGPAPLPTLAEARAAAAAGDRARALEMLRALLARHEENQRLTDVAIVLDELARLDPDDMGVHHKRVELAARMDDRTRLVDSYLGLAGVLARAGQMRKARAVYQRVLDLDPACQEAREALAAAAAPTMPEAPGAPASGAAPTGNGYVDLGAMLRAEQPRRSTRMVTEERAPSGDEQADFTEMLRKFKQGIAETVAEEDHESHYDLGVAYKEMGLVDEAIASFQRALRGTDRRARSYEALGQCFVEKGQHRIAAAVLRNALLEPGADDQQLVGVLYLLGQAAEALGQTEEAMEYYQRVYAVDMTFRDVAARLDAIAQVRS